ncbi:UNVERIFIED_CONTAM: hypothetical protein Slati_1958700 [Sesamum latifolium]|uniref:Pectinesterase inhibitor domain-containing protein n=1 Tax=Sesamum latifolium TaxID=2727402 RepID=A0AAW2WKJ3_9LAMI
MSIAPPSTGHKLTDTEIKHLCSKTSNLGGCYKLLKSDPRTANVDARGLAEVSIDLASNKANKTYSLINSFINTTHDSQLKNIYKLCSSNYNDVIRDFKAIKNYLHAGSYKNIPVQVKDASEEIKQCKKVFGGATNDRAHIKKKNQELEFLINIVEKQLHLTISITNNGFFFPQDHLHCSDHGDCHSLFIGSPRKIRNGNRPQRSLLQHQEAQTVLENHQTELSSFGETDSRSVAGAVIGLAVAKAQEIHDRLNQLYQDSGDDKLKEKYTSCSKNYNDANRNLYLAKTNLDSNDFQNIPVQMDDTLEELKSCRHEFDKDSFDPAHIRNRNKEFGVYVDIVKVATDRLQREDDRLQENDRH